jgi:hypothetical protein
MTHTSEGRLGVGGEKPLRCSYARKASYIDLPAHLCFTLAANHSLRGALPISLHPESCHARGSLKAGSCRLQRLHPS